MVFFRGSPHRYKMRKSTRHWIVAAAAATLLANWACKKEAPQLQDDDTLPLASVLAVAQPRADRQLLDGFWNVENNAWRWTKHNFSVLLMPPRGAAQKGARLEFRFGLTESVIERRKSVTLSVSVGGLPLPSETYTASGSYLYKCEVPVAAFKAGGPVKVAFTADRYLGAGEVEGRELALVAHSFALTPK